MKKALRRFLSAAMAAALVAGMCMTASAFTYPSSYWPLHNQWETVSAGSDTGAIITLAQQIYDELMPLGMSYDAETWRPSAPRRPGPARSRGISTAPSPGWSGS